MIPFPIDTKIQILDFHTHKTSLIGSRAPFLAAQEICTRRVAQICATLFR